MGTYKNPTNDTARADLIDARRVHELLDDFRVVMLGTYDDASVDGRPRLHARPMTIARLEDDMTVKFVTAIDAGIVSEATTVNTGTLIAQASNKQLTLDGTFRVTQDRAALREIWSKHMDAWFEGPDDPQACLLVFTPVRAEVWDSTGAKGIRYLFQAAKAVVTGRPLEPTDAGDKHAKVSLR